MIGYLYAPALIADSYTRDTIINLLLDLARIESNYLCHHLEDASKLTIMFMEEKAIKDDCCLLVIGQFTWSMPFPKYNGPTLKVEIVDSRSK